MNDSLNEIRLTPQMIASLYGQSLVAPVDNTQVNRSTKKDAVAVKFLGNNSKKVTVLVHVPGHSFMPENELTFLTKMLDACRMNIGDVAIVNLATFNYPLVQLMQELQPTKLISFGAPTGTPMFQLNHDGNTDMLEAPPIREMLADLPEARLLKTKLWVALKQMFNL